MNTTRPASSTLLHSAFQRADLQSSAPRFIWRRTGAVLAGLFTVFSVTSAVDAMLHALDVFPPVGHDMSSPLYLLATAYRLVIGVLGGYVTGRLAPNRPVLHATILGCVGLVLSLVGCIVMWGMGPAWYPLTLAATAVPTAWLGGRCVRAAW